MADNEIGPGQEEPVDSDWVTNPFQSSRFIRYLHINGVLEPGLFVTLEVAAHPGVSKEFARAMAVIIDETIDGLLRSPSDKT